MQKSGENWTKKTLELTGLAENRRNRHTLNLSCSCLLLFKDVRESVAFRVILRPLRVVLLE
jgi:hypothetical protein